MARDPFRQLAVIRNASGRGKIINDCYRLMYKEALWLKVFQHITGREPDREDRKDIARIIDELRNETFRFQKICCYKQHLLLRQLVLEVIRLILAAVFEPVFIRSQRGNNFFRILQNVKEEFSQVTWCINGKIKNWSPQDVRCRLKEIIARKIDDRRFLLLIDGVLKSYHLDQRERMHTKKKGRFASLSALFFNIYFHELDCQLQEIQKEEQPVVFTNSSSYRNVQEETFVYIRWKEQFLIGVFGRKKDAQNIKAWLESWLIEKLHLLPKQISLQVTHLEKPVIFYDYTIRHCPVARKNGKRVIRLEIPLQIIHEVARNNGYGVLDRFQAKERGFLIHKSEQEIIATYNEELLAFARYYHLADNLHVLAPLYYLAKKSMLKTIAQKRRTTVKKVLAQFMEKRGNTLYFRPAHSHDSREWYPFIPLESLKKKKWLFYIDTYGRAGENKYR